MRISSCVFAHIMMASLSPTEAWLDGDPGVLTKLHLALKVHGLVQVHEDKVRDRLSHQLRRNCPDLSCRHATRHRPRSDLVALPLPAKK